MSKEDSFDYSVLKEGCIIFEPRDLFESAIIEYDEKKMPFITATIGWSRF